MALTELTALDAAYQALRPLGHEARRRALQWLSDALVSGDSPRDEPALNGSSAYDVELEEPVAVNNTMRRRKAAAPSTRSAAAVTMAPKPRNARRVKSGGSQKHVTGQRAYRRMPEPEVIMKAYRKLGSVSGLADQFDVPRHTANHWARRLRSQGYDIGRAS